MMEKRMMHKMYKMRGRSAILFASVGLALLTACGQGGASQVSGERGGPQAAEEGRAQAGAASQRTEGTEESGTQTETGPQNAEVSAQGSGTDEGSGQGGGHTLIVWFSMPEDVDTSGVDAVAGASIVVKDGQVMGNIEYVARIVQEMTGADGFRIETVEAYPKDHDPLVDQAAEEQDAAFRPQLAGQIEDLGQYDTIILGYPNWWADLPMPLYSFLEAYDLSGKTIIPYVVHGGSSFSGTLDTIAQLQPGATISGDTLSISRNAVADSEDQIRRWVEGLGVGED